MENDSLVITLKPRCLVGDELYRTLRKLGITSVAGYSVDGHAVRGYKKQRPAAIENPQLTLIKDKGIKPKHLDHLMGCLSEVASRLTADLVLNFKLNMGQSGILVLDPDRESIGNISRIRSDTIDFLRLGVNSLDFNDYIRLGRVDNPDEQKYLMETRLGIEIAYPVLCLFARNMKCGNRPFERSFLIPTNWHN